MPSLWRSTARVPHWRAAIGVLWVGGFLAAEAMLGAVLVVNAASRMVGVARGRRVTLPITTIWIVSALCSCTVGAISAPTGIISSSLS